MMAFRLEQTAKDSLDEINDYTARWWGEEQAARYTTELFQELERISRRTVPWRPLPATFGLAGYSRRWRKHVIYWYDDANEIYFFAILHERMDQIVRAQAAFGTAR